MMTNFPLHLHHHGIGHQQKLIMPLCRLTRKPDQCVSWHRTQTHVSAAPTVANYVIIFRVSALVVYVSRSLVTASISVLARVVMTTAVIRPAGRSAVRASAA